MLHIIWRVVLTLFPVSEIALALFKRANRRTSQVQDQGSMLLLWMVILAAIFLAGVAGSFRQAHLPISPELRDWLALSLVATGLGVRWYAILFLGRLFTVDVAIQKDHALVRTGPYRHVRHPSYTGLLIAFCGLSVSFRNWLSMLVLIVPITLAVLSRIRKEEAALHAALGPAYDAYCAKTKRLLPGVF